MPAQRLIATATLILLLSATVSTMRAQWIPCESFSYPASYPRSPDWIAATCLRDTTIDSIIVVQRIGRGGHCNCFNRPAFFTTDRNDSNCIAVRVSVRRLPDSIIIRSEYALYGNMESTWQPIAYTQRYDRSGRLLREEYSPIGAQRPAEATTLTEHHYDNRGRCTTTTIRTGSAINRCTLRWFDARDSITEEVEYDFSRTATRRVVVFSADGNERTESRYENGWMTYTYRITGLRRGAVRVHEATVVNPHTGVLTTTITGTDSLLKDSKGRPAGHVFRDASGHFISRYDSAGRFIERRYLPPDPIFHPEVIREAFGFANGNLVRAEWIGTYMQRHVQTIGYDAFERRTSVETRDSSGVISRFDITYVPRR